MSKLVYNKSVWARIAVIAAGPIFNFILAFVCSVVIIGSIGYDPCMVDVVYDNSPAVSAGLKEGDKIIKVNNQKITYSGVRVVVYFCPSLSYIIFIVSSAWYTL